MNLEFCAFIHVGLHATGKYVDPDEVLQYFSWSAYAGVAVLYSAFVFWGNRLSNLISIIRRSRTGRDYIGDDSADPSDELACSTSQVVLIHSLFLFILLSLLRLTSLAVPYLPHWMTDTFAASHTTIVDLLCLLAFGILVQVERQCLFSVSSKRGLNEAR